MAKLLFIHYSYPPYHSTPLTVGKPSSTVPYIFCMIPTQLFRCISAIAPFPFNAVLLANCASAIQVVHTRPHMKTFKIKTGCENS